MNLESVFRVKTTFDLEMFKLLLTRSTKTVKKHIDNHNADVRKFKECPRCSRAKCEHSNDTIAVGKQRHIKR